MLLIRGGVKMGTKKVFQSGFRLIRPQTYLGIGLILIFSACSKKNESQADRKEDLQLIANQLDEITALDFDGGPAPYWDFFTDDATILPPGRLPISGKQNVLEFYRSAFEGIKILEVLYDEPEIDLDGDLAVRRYSGRATLANESTQDTVVFRNKYMDVVTKQADGTWKISVHMWNQNPSDKN